jgi:hypothetical protein
VALLTGLDKGHVQADFQFLSNHERTPLGLRDFIMEINRGGCSLFNRLQCCL